MVLYFFVKIELRRWKVGDFLDIKQVIAFFMLGTLIIYPFLRDALVTLYKLNVPKKKKQTLILKEQALIRKISMSYIKKHVKYHKILVRVLIFVNYVYLSIMLVFFSLVVLYIFEMQVIEMLESIANLKLVILDLPFCLFLLIKTGHDKKHGGIKWKF